MIPHRRCKWSGECIICSDQSGQKGFIIFSLPSNHLYFHLHTKANTNTCTYTYTTQIQIQTLMKTFNKTQMQTQIQPQIHKQTQTKVPTQIQTQMQTQIQTQMQTHICKYITKGFIIPFFQIKATPLWFHLPHYISNNTSVILVKCKYTYKLN